ncbi:MAG: M16 family metallopeptidase [Bryobacteraceae bacterium]
MTFQRALLPALLAAAAFGQQFDVRTTVLANGMKVLVHEDHDIPNVATYFFFKIGSRNERPGTTGISHFFEHMMFNGAKKYGPKQFDNQMERNGGRNNAYTTRDQTVYTDWFPRAALELMFDMEADRIRDLSFDPKIVESERGVIASERRMSVENSNFGALYEQLNAAAFIAHPYHWPVLGWASDIQGWTMDDLKQHWLAGYAPNNCVLVVTGDVTGDEVMRLARKYLEPIPRREPPAAVRTVEPEQRGERRVVVRKFAQLPMQMVSYHVPAASSPDWHAIEVLDAVLAEGRSSRLHRRLVDREQLASTVRVMRAASLDPGLITFTIQPRSGVDLARVEQALYQELARIQAEDVTAAELEKAKNQAMTDFYRAIQTIAGKANLLGSYETLFGDYRKLFTAVEELEKVTAADVRRVAGRYLLETNRTVATLIPEPGGAR